jgi:uncharacterized protein YidB (DUF937 family)
MLDGILGQIKGQLGDSLQQQEGVDSSQLDGIMDIVQSVTGEKVGKQMLGDGLGPVMNLFSNNNNTTEADTLQSDITGGIASSLVEKLGFSGETATNITSTVIPMVINLVTEKNSETPDDDASPLTELFGGGDLGGLAGKLGDLF